MPLALRHRTDLVPGLGSSNHIQLVFHNSNTRMTTKTTRLQTTRPKICMFLPLLNNSSSNHHPQLRRPIAPPALHNNNHQILTRDILHRLPLPLKCTTIKQQPSHNLLLLTMGLLLSQEPEPQTTAHSRLPPKALHTLFFRRQPHSLAIHRQPASTSSISRIVSHNRRPLASGQEGSI